MEIVIELSADPQDGPSQKSEPLQQLRRIVQAAGLRLESVEAGTSIRYRVVVSDRASADRLAAAIRALPMVAAAYFKPSDAPP